MAQVLEERVDVGTLKGDYQFGFHDPDQSVFRARKGLDREIVEQITGVSHLLHMVLRLVQCGS